MKKGPSYLYALACSLVPAFASSSEIGMGTTILAIRYRDGVVVGADSRTSASGYVSNRFATKVSFILENDFGLNPSPPSDLQLKSALLKQFRAKKKDGATQLEYHRVKSSTCCICRSGSSADTQYLADQARHQLLRRKVINHTTSSISEVAHLLKRYLSNDALQASLICAGYDHLKDDGVIFSIDMGGTMMEQPLWACSGSGSTFVMGYIDNHFPEDANFTEDEAVEFVENAVKLAMDRDGSSGGVIRLYVINKDGKKSILRLPKSISDEPVSLS
eukprot:CAMPEP_0194117874 /NCGR_PEP_ID=MMETSP0150-20130528/33205_1 /TAXON_ID=122233 /ORGANISM="Chaetoceros debilis, Strain MM31A-1" /LENGTH=274 /DNA_ID=CAMNT_0038809059 /DNA_START=45 /DNA_END=866 /DNA_ORIENTATION=+